MVETAAARPARSDEAAAHVDPDAAFLKREGKSGSSYGYKAHVAVDQGSLLVRTAKLTPANVAETVVADELIIANSDGGAIYADKAYDTRDFVRDLRDLKVTPHVAQNTKNRSSAIDGRTTRHPGYAVSQRKRKRVEEIFGWIKTVGLMHKTRHRGLARVGWMFTFTAAAYNLVRIRNLGVVVC